ncbi:MAG: nickel pincer cofactor biosynthesis protein LarC [Candidatus Dadabacteria bacterium]|nr:MAG: nickel pincer cofactor biosynthesis protein LarC [Candidatus Dadabacteria bacterium]
MSARAVKIAYFDAAAGISGDMTVAALLDAGRNRGIDAARLGRDLALLGIEGFHVSCAPRRVAGIEALSFQVVVDNPRAAQPRSWREIRSLLDESRARGLAAGVVDRSVRVFEVLAEAEARVHGVSPADVHFHEVGAIDSIVDVVAASWCLEMLGIERCYVGPLPLGSGTVATAHGRLPVPAPATVLLLEGFDVVPEGDGETVTPTGAAILKALAYPGRPPFRLETSGTGAGSHASGERPNVLRVLVGEAGVDPDREVFAVEADIDDMTPEAMAFACERIREQGALDVSVAPVQMKKSRLGMRLTVLCKPQDLDRIARAVLTHTSSIGVRYRWCGRIVLARRIEVVRTEFGDIALKVVCRPDGSETAEPEFDDVARAALDHGVSFACVRAAAERAWRARVAARDREKKSEK